MTKLSVIIPNRNCPYTSATIADVLQKARGEVEVIVAVDENWPEPRIPSPRVIYLPPGPEPVGLRVGINRAVAVATGEFIMKADDHCLFAPGFDLELIRAHAEDNWVQIPRRYSLDAERWQINRERPKRDYSYLCYPERGKKHDDGIHGVEWWDRDKERTDRRYDVDDTMSMQGSCYFMTRHHFTDRLGGMQELGYGQFAQEAQEIGLKTVLGGGRLLVNKRTYYAHWHKGKSGRGYGFSDRLNVKGINWSAEYWMTGQWAGAVRTMRSFIEQFWPVPTWPVDALERWDEYMQERFGARLTV